MHKFYTVKEVLEILRISEPTFYNWKRIGRIRPIKLGGKNLISEDELNRVIESAKHEETLSRNG